MTEEVGRVRVAFALALGTAALVLIALFWLVQPGVGFAWLALGLLPTPLGIGALTLAGWSVARLRRHGLGHDRTAVAALGVGAAGVVLGAPTFVFMLWVLVLILVGGNA